MSLQPTDRERSIAAALAACFRRITNRASAPWAEGGGRRGPHPSQYGRAVPEIPAYPALPGFRPSPTRPATRDPPPGVACCLRPLVTPTVTERARRGLR